MKLNTKMTLYLSSLIIFLMNKTDIADVENNRSFICLNETDSAGVIKKGIYVVYEFFQR